MTRALLAADTPSDGTEDGKDRENAESETADRRPRDEDAHSDALARLDARAADVRDEQLERARSRLAARDALTPEAECVLEDVAERLVADLFDAPARAVEDATDAETEERVCDLFCPEE